MSDYINCTVCSKKITMNKTYICFSCRGKECKDCGKKYNPSRLHQVDRCSACVRVRKTKQQSAADIFLVV